MTSSPSNFAEQLLPELVAFAAAHGLAYGIKDDAARFVHAPMSLLPSALPRTNFEQAQQVAPLFNLLVDRIARDPEWLHGCLAGVTVADEFTGRLLDIAKQVHKEGIQQNTFLGIHRSDYMLDKPRGEGGDYRFLQVELNTIASSFGCLSSRVSEMHRYVFDRYVANADEDVQAWIKERYGIPDGSSVKSWLESLPVNKAISSIPAAIALAATKYREELGAAGSSSIVVFVVQDGETNSFDQRWLEYNLWNTHRIVVKRYSLGQIHEHGKLEERNGRKVLVMKNQEVAVVYFRAGYTPTDYPSENQWSARLMLERSASIKCPSIDYHLVGAKKVQQRLAEPGVVERFMPNSQESELIRQFFAGLWTLDMKEDEDGSAQKEKELAIASPDGYVLKPQREGGGNNFYGKDITSKLTEMNAEEQAAYILMQRIFPKEQNTILVKGGELAYGDGVNELGMFGVFLGSGGDDVALNETAGHLLRTKFSGVDEGGVASGYSCLDSPFLV